MNHVYPPDSLPPPPPPSSHPAVQPVPASASGHGHSRRTLAQQALGISTSLTTAQRFGNHLHPHTPASPRTAALSPAASQLSSASPSSSLSSPMASARQVASATSTYNPQEWARSGPGPGQYVPHTSRQSSRRVVGTRDSTGMEASMPSPPPPYSASPQSPQPPSRAQIGSPLVSNFASLTSSPVQHASEFNSPITPATSGSSGFPSVRRSLSGEHQYQVGTPQHQASPTSYPPPPPPPPAGQRDRSGSRSRFVLSAITGRHRTNSNASPANAPEVSPRQPNAGLARLPHGLQTTSPVVPADIAPAARRAASTGSVPAINSGPTRHPTDVIFQNNPRDSHNHGFALPPPPPGPPPNARSQSLNRVGEGPSSVVGSAGLHASLMSNALGPVPPTPADWVDDGYLSHESRPSQSTVPTSVSRSDSFQDSVAPHVRDSSASRGIRERRSEARARAQGVSYDSHTSPDLTSAPLPEAQKSGEIKPANLVLSQNNGAISRRRHVSKSKTSPLLDGKASPTVQRHLQESDSHSRSQPGSATAPPDSAPRGSVPGTPSFAGQGFLSNPSNNSSPVVTAKPQAVTRDEQRHATHALLSPRINLAGVSADRAAFAEASLERHQRFVELEARASTNEERLQVFADFIVKESRLRRDRYAEVFDALGSDVLELTRDMWRPLDGGRRTKTPTPGPTNNGHLTPDVQHSLEVELPPEPSSAGSAPNSAALTPGTEPDSPSDLAANHARIRSESRNAFQPMLSPIPSMAMSTAADEESVRGRTSSRWWEASSDGLSAGTGGRPLRTKRESKYMGLPREARENLQWIPEDSQRLAGPSSMYAALGSNEFPPEKTGWHENTHIGESSSARQTPRTPNIPRLDVSRLITLPPPYPRHHPAVNNNHPDLASLRTVLRGLSGSEEVSQIRQKYEQDEMTFSFRPESPTAWTDRRNRLRQTIQRQVSVGGMSFAEAAQKEAEFEQNEAKRGRDRAQKSFDHFQAQVVMPLNAQYKSKLNVSSVAIEQLVEGLSNEANSHNPNATQEEGDEQPELLEKLTLVKWLHEAREQLYKDVIGLEDESNEHYKTIILFPYRQAGNMDKVQEVESFFGKDLNDRREEFERKTLRRFEELLGILEKHVTRGVETQLSAFWDIAPELVAVIHKVPSNLSSCEIQIPAQEYDENPTYEEYPLQYLYGLLLHAERSAYQFIESQINLQCLLHEAKTSVMVAGCRLMQTQRRLAGEEAQSVEDEMNAIRRSEDATLTANLKERVSVVEDQWRQALGLGIRECRGRVKQHLLEQGGYDESLEE